MWQVVPHSENLKQHKAAICEKTSLKSQLEGVHEKKRDHNFYTKEKFMCPYQGNT